jgi:hypothetical protein
MYSRVRYTRRSIGPNPTPIDHNRQQFRTSTNTITITNTSSIIFQIIKWYGICKRKMTTYRSKSTKSYSFETSRTCLNEMTRDYVMIWMHESFSYWCETSLKFSAGTDTCDVIFDIISESGSTPLWWANG